jgi:hypothetical protein
MALINKYNDFILERKLELFFESRIYISDDLSSMLKSKEMSNNHISRMISSYANSYNTDTDTKVNFIDITDSNDRLSFINDGKGMELYNNDEDAYKSTSRNEVKIGKIIRKLLSSLGKSDITKSHKDIINLLSDKDIEEFVNLYKSTYDIEKGKMGRLELVEGEDVKKYYLHNNYESEDGILGNSCMRYERCQDYIEFYVMNDVKLLILFADDNKEKINARAIIWENVSMDGGDYKNTFMDRIYTTNDSDNKLFKKYAEENKWWYKSTQDSDESTTLYGPDDDYEDDEHYDIVVKVKKGKHKYPYMDTLKYYHYEDGYLSNNASGDYIELISVDGRYDCDNCDGRGESECYECDGRGETECRDCDGYGVRDCNSCDGDERESCPKCDGSAVGTCPECDGDNDECEHCGGDNEVSCDRCDGDGDIECRECDGSGKEDCESCDGDGDIRCEYCDAEGTQNCSDCEDYHNWGY